jgi:hypothetical protein
MNDNPRDIYKTFSTDDLATTILSLKEQIDSIKTVLYYCEDELRDRLTANNAKHLLGEAYRIKSSVKRDITWDQSALRRAMSIAKEENRDLQFLAAFPTKFEPSIIKLNALLKLGGKTAEAIEAARLETKEKVYLSYDRLPSG